ncbi:MAG TPA: MSMEG_0568 family radical SAM protein, partial [Tepidisphaeraceae bacterium]|nr:MSMEG_0568 family radical SAM protein [Tepidisphaeraceae bacterium]
LQWLGMRIDDPTVGVASRKGGAGPSDHKAVTVNDRTVMVPVHTHQSHRSPYLARTMEDGSAVLERQGVPVGRVTFPGRPRFYSLQTFDGIPYWKIAVLHGRDVLATTVLQTCIRYQNRETTCQFCAIGQSLKSGKTIAHKTPEQLAEVARAAVLLDGVKHMVMTTGTPNLTDRGARVLAESAFEIKGAVDLPIQGQCEPPDDFAWFKWMRDAGIDALGMHLEAVEPETRARIMPGKSQVALATYLDAFEASVAVFGRGQVSTYILAGLGDSRESILRMSERLIELGVYPFVVPFVPISGTPMEHQPAPSAEFMRPLLAELGQMLAEAGMTSSEIKAGCGRCGACSSLAGYEKKSC